MRRSVAYLWGAILVTGVAVRSKASGDIGGVQGGSFHSAIPYSEQLQYGDLKTTIQRTAIQVPDDYGKLIQITPAKGTSVLWFQSDDGALRNVIIASDDLWMIRRGGTSSSTKY